MAWSRECPTFVRKWESHKMRNEEMKYIYFPTDDPLTWEMAAGNKEAPDNQNITPQTMQCHPPNQVTNSEWQTVHQRRHPHREDQHVTKSNRVPLGTQARLTDTWKESQPKTQTRPNTTPPTTPMEDMQSTPTSWVPSPIYQHNLVSAEDYTGWD